MMFVYMAIHMVARIAIFSVCHSNVLESPKEEKLHTRTLNQDTVTWRQTPHKPQLKNKKINQCLTAVTRN